MVVQSQPNSPVQGRVDLSRLCRVYSTEYLQGWKLDNQLTVLTYVQSYFLMFGLAELIGKLPVH